MRRQTIAEILASSADEDNIAEPHPPHVCAPDDRKFSGASFCAICRRHYPETSVLTLLPRKP